MKTETIRETCQNRSKARLQRIRDGFWSAVCQFCGSLNRAVGKYHVLALSRADATEARLSCYPHSAGFCAVPAGLLSCICT